MTNKPAELAAHAVTMSRDERETLAARLVKELVDEESEQAGQG